MSLIYDPARTFCGTYTARPVSLFSDGIYSYLRRFSICLNTISGLISKFSPPVQCHIMLKTEKWPKKISRHPETSGQRDNMNI